MNKKAEVYDLLVRRLVGNKYAFGQRLSVKDIVADSGASRQPIMAALDRLHTEGFVRIVPQVGCEVINPSREQIADFYLMFERMEGLLAELAAARRTDKQLSELRDIQVRIRAIDSAAPSAPKEFCDLNRFFHKLVHEMAHSEFVDERQSNHFNMSDFFITHSCGFRALLSDAGEEHEAIIEAIASQSPTRARTLAERHIEGVVSHVLGGLRPNEREKASAGSRGRGRSPAVMDRDGSTASLSPRMGAGRIKLPKE